MRRTFIQKLVHLAELDPRIILLTGDLGYTVLEPFIDKFPNRFFNVGVAEQNMVGLSTGLAEAGLIPFVYSIATFASLRPYEFIRNGPVAHQLPVRIVGVGGGFEYGHAGMTHYGLEDVGVMRLQPGLTVIAPADHEQAASALSATWDLSGPIYYRLGKDDTTTIPGLSGRFNLGHLEIVREGSDLLMISLGSITSEAIAAADILATNGIDCTIAIVASFNPSPVDDLVELLARFPITLTVESHYISGGIGSLVSEVIAENGLNSRIIRCGIKATPNEVTGSQSFMQDKYGLSADSLVKSALLALGERAR